MDCIAVHRPNHPLHKMVFHQKRRDPEAVRLKEERSCAIHAPILNNTGHYDGDQPGAMAYYRYHMGSHSLAKAQHYLVIGPWDHAGTRTPNAEFGGMKFGNGLVYHSAVFERT